MAVPLSYDSSTKSDYLELKAPYYNAIDPSEKGHTSQYGNMRCAVCENTIDFQLSVYGWDDTYPHCDGEL